MESHYYEASSLAEAFEKASKDPSVWDSNFATLDALQAMASAIRDGSVAITPMGADPIYSCPLGDFRVATKPSGFGIALLRLRRYESGIENPAAAEVLAYHRYHRGRAFYAQQLLVHSDHIQTIEELDAAYALLESDPLRPQIDRANGTETVTFGGTEYERPKYVVR